MLGLLVVGAAGCSARAPQDRSLPAPGPRPATSAPAPAVSGAPTAGADDEDVRQALLADVVALQASTAALADPGAGAPVVAAVGAALAEQARSLTTRADAQRPAPAGPATTGPTSPADLVTALAAAAAAAAGRVESPSGPMARLTAAVAAGHAVAADVLARASSVPAPAGQAGQAGPAAGPASSATGRSQVVALVRAREVEAQARYAYGVVAVHLRGDLRSTALARRTVHDEAVGASDEALDGAPGADPGPRDAYVLPFAVVDDVSAATLAAAVEDGCADAWADVVAAADPRARSGPAAAVTERALQGARWRYRLGRGADLTPLPGLSGRT